MNWKKNPISSAEVRRLNEHYGIDMVTSSIMVRRNQSSAEQVKFLLERELTYLHNPFLFDDMEAVVDRIQEAQAEGELVRIYGDRDVDGITSTALLTQELRSMGIEVTTRLPEGDEPYGLSLRGVEEAFSDNVTLLITVDSWISNIEEITAANQKGIDVIVLDHHVPGESLPPAYAIINPKLVGSGYPFADLAGVGVVAKVIWALRFAQTDLWGEEFILAHAQPGNETVIIQAMRVQNLLVIDQVIEEINPGLIPLDQSKAFAFLGCGLPIFVLDEATERAQLKEAFGKMVDIHLIDLRPSFEKALPIVRSKGLFSLAQMSRAAKYSPHGKDELAVLYSLFVAYAYKAHPSLDSGYEEILDLVAIGTIADLMPMEDENRILVHRGMRVLNKRNRTALLPLLTAQNLLGKQISSTDISWQISPPINASGRMGRPSVALDLLLSENLGQAQLLTDELLSMNKERQRLGQEAWERILPISKDSFESTGSKMVIINDPEIARGITGVMANRLLRHYKAPALVIAPAEEGKISGSLRSSEPFHARDFLSNFEDLLLDYGGHACAGGFSAEAMVLEELLKRMHDRLDEMDCPEEASEEVVIDCTLPAAYMSPKMIEVVEFFEPYGEKNPPLVLHIEGAIIESIQRLSNKNGGPNHLKLTLAYGEYRWPALYWESGDRVGQEFDVGTQVNVAFRLGRNYFRNQESLQLVIIDLKTSESA
jgi:single-stranded-DNA-specific exonuclease